MFSFDDSDDKGFDISTLIWTRNNADKKDIACVRYNPDKFYRVYILLYDANPGSYILHTGHGGNRVDCPKEDIVKNLIIIFKKVMKKSEIDSSDLEAIKQA